MAYAALTAFVAKDRIPPKGIVVTAVLPGGCPLNCDFCIVNQRDERRGKSHLTSEHLSSLVSSVRNQGMLGGAAIVGDEPLQSHCWPMAKSFLRQATDYGVPTALISNGYNLFDFIDELRELKSTKILISLDAASEKHDQIRRKPGAFARISQGIEKAAAHSDLRERLSIATIMMPQNLDLIPEIIDFTAAHKIPRFIVSPLLTASRTTPLQVDETVMTDAWQKLPTLLARANSVGVTLHVSDEFAMLGPWEERLDAIGVEILAPKAHANLIRVDAAGRIETLDTMRAGSSTELTMPECPNEIDGVVKDLVRLCKEPAQVAA